MPQQISDAIKKVDLVLSLLRCADDALLSGDDCASDVLATHFVVAGMLNEIRKTFSI